MDLQQFLESAFYILKGTGWTAGLILGAMSLGFAIGLPLASLRVYGPRPLGRLLGVYVWFFRGVPILVLLFLVYFGVYPILERLLHSLFHLRHAFSPFSASLAALGLASGAYQSQIFKGAILSVSPGQFKAARALGFSSFTAVTRIVLPQALRLSIPAWSNEYSILLKDSAVAYTLGTLEIMARTKFMASQTYRHVTFYLLAGALYFVLTWLGVSLLKRVRRATMIPGLGNQAL
ncbi:MAG: amino acid ABC transporter permease [Deltaproteobacteria bacterium]|jgi:polar amino acid transport system permease protein|nr:amino acid ABC transporter permease [Deltaproteobacteria bacterium]